VGAKDVIKTKIVDAKRTGNCVMVSLSSGKEVWGKVVEYSPDSGEVKILTFKDKFPVMTVFVDEEVVALTLPLTGSDRRFFDWHYHDAINRHVPNSAKDTRDRESVGANRIFFMCPVCSHWGERLEIDKFVSCPECRVNMLRTTEQLLYWT
jgi:uncharacterized CHY-type Zn-finger protein